MIRKPKFVLALLALSATLIGGWVLLSGPASPARADSLETAKLLGSGILDGLTFSSELGPVGKPADVQDTLVFDNGMFVSIQCEQRCNYPASPYFVRQRGDQTEFISETRCPGKDAKIVWRGTVKEGKISGEFTWTVTRWYWTVEKTFSFEGTLAEPPTPLASN